MQTIAVIGGGPAGLMAAEVAAANGLAVQVFESKGSVGRKFLLAGKGGLNLTHSDDKPAFLARYGSRRAEVGRWLEYFDAQSIRTWARELGVETFVGTSGRVFPADLKAAPLLRAWVHRLRNCGVTFRVRHRCLGFDTNRDLQFATPTGEFKLQADAVVLAMGGASWPQLGSDGQWTAWLDPSEIAPLQPANCGFDVNWTPLFVRRFGGAPVKSAKVSTLDVNGNRVASQSEFVITTTGIEGPAIYALSAALRDCIRRDGAAELLIDLLPALTADELVKKLNQPRAKRTLTEHLRRVAHLDGVKTGLVYECSDKEAVNDPEQLVQVIKKIKIKLLRPRPLAEAISTAGGIRFAALDDHLMLLRFPGVFCAGEMVDWEAPTGGYLLTACLASGRVAGQGAAQWLARSSVSKRELP